VAGVAAGLYVAFVAVAFGWRTWLQYRRTKDYGLRALSSRVGSIEWIGVLFLIGGVTLAGAAPLAELVGIVAQSGPRAGSWFGTVGLVLVLLGFTGTIVAQLQMGDSWRIGVEGNETTRLVMVGLFGRVRNPIFSGMLLAIAGLLLLVPNVLSAVALCSSFLGIEIQVRRVEEPYLTRVHGNRYLSYARKVGRFFPRIGCLS
jgi:protein-S-isoprenylcysteine O-methyltransferase Ste14